jgi:hypothetical protein
VFFYGGGTLLSNIIEHTDLDSEENAAKDGTAYIRGKLLEAVQNLPLEIKQMSEFEMIRQLDPGPTDYALRRSFWKAIETAEALGKDSIFQKEVYSGVVSQQTFNDLVLTNPMRVAWFTRPIVDHAHYYEALNKLAVQKILDYVKDNPVNEKLLPSIIKIAEMSANRAYGAVAQKMQIQSKNLNIDVTGKPEANIPSSDQGQLTQRVEELQAKLLDQAKDVTPKE